MSKEVDLQVLSPRDVQRALDASQLLLPHQHRPDCPVHVGASMTCVAPAVCCVYDEWAQVDTRAGVGYPWRAAIGYMSLDAWAAREATR